MTRGAAKSSAAPTVATTSPPRRTSRTASSPKLLDRMIGLETEYVIRFHADATAAAAAPVAASSQPQFRPHNRTLFALIVSQLQRALPTMRALPGKPGMFLANGGAVWYEQARHARNAALFEGATPECRGPRQVLACQRAQDTLLANAARDADALGGAVTLCKSDRDAQGHAYGSQENYDCELATGWRWHAWRIGVVLLLPTLVIMYGGVFGVAIGLAVYYAVAAVIYPFVEIARSALAAISPAAPDAPQLRRFIFGSGWRDALSEDGDLEFLPAWLHTLFYRFMHLFALPAAIGLTLLGRLTAFARLRRMLLPFLITRAVFAGSGRVTPRGGGGGGGGGGFEIAAKASGMNATAGVNELLGLRPVFSFGHFIKAIAFASLRTSTKYRPLLSRRQRLQISLGDGNMCEESQYLRVATTALVIDAIESGAITHVPRVRMPLRAMRKLVADPTLQTRVRTAGGQRMTALEIQRFYLDACRDFVATRPDAPAEAHEILRRWADVLQLLETDRSKLVGRVDWVTKTFLLDQCGADADLEVRKKIDLRYHELSTEGYFHALSTAGVAEPILSPQELDDALRNPPPGTPAAVRGRYVREFATDPTARASWECITLGGAGRAVVLRRIDLTRHGATPEPS
jgi:proteasome accessory factor A